MKIARYWTRAQAEATGSDGEPVVATARGWSDESLDAARIKALEIARRVAERIKSGLESKRYPYGDRPIPEPILRQLNGAMVTRNGYGALVLNAENLMFIDVDRKPATPGGLGKMLGSLFGKPKPEAAAADPMAGPMDAILKRHGLSGRLYETAAGYRVMITSAKFKPGSSESEELLKEFGADPLYTRLCRTQESFRARLTPKPWRCEYRNLAVSYPYETPRDQATFQSWAAEYQNKSAAYATCRFVADLGSGSVLPEFRELIDYHDQESKAGRTMRLA